MLHCNIDVMGGPRWTGPRPRGTERDMAEIVNLRMARKAKKRAAKERQAEANRARFGQSKAEKSAREQDDARAAKLLDGTKRDPD